MIVGVRNPSQIFL